MQVGNTLDIQSEIERLSCNFYGQYQHSCQYHIPQEEANHDTNDIHGTFNDFNTIIEGSIFKDVITNYCFTHEIESDFIWTPQGYRDYTNRIVYIKQLTIPLVAKKQFRYNLIKPHW